MIDQKLSPGVVNVLIDYVLKTNNMKFEGKKQHKKRVIAFLYYNYS